MTTTDAPAPALEIPATPADVRSVLVVGAGQMGSGIAQVFAQSGRRVLLADVAPSQLATAKAGIAKSAARLHGKGKLTDAQLAGATDGIEYVAGLDGVDLSDVSLANEAATEQLATKLAIFADLDRRVPASALLATNTSSISITTIAAATQRPQHVVGMHFLHPVPVLELV
jgi:3-hydroxybutyryl-CoA dehydrogenase